MALPPILCVVPLPGAPTDAPVRSTATERFWLPILGPTATWAGIQLADLAAQADSAGVGINVAEFAVGLGVTPSKLQNALDRLVHFGPAGWAQESRRCLAIRCRWPMPDGKARYRTERRLDNARQGLLAAH